jgi:hypothetical protein
LEDHGFQASTGKEFIRPYLKKTYHKKGLVKWLKVWALSSSPSAKKMVVVGEKSLVEI